jgi:hypothetical protein
MRKISRKGWITKLDTIVSHIVIKRDGKCVVCGSGDQLTCGHVFSRKHFSTRWDLLNCHCQCWPCNYKHVHDTYPYLQWFRNRFSQEVLDQLYEKFNSETHLKAHDLASLYEELKLILDK